MIKLYDNGTNELLGEISDVDLAFMIDQLEEEWAEDHDYYINWPTIDLFESKGASALLLEILRTALADRDDMEIRWSRS
jgi:hypothetical protein